MAEIRLRGRRLLIGTVPLFSLTLAVGIMLVFSLSLMPLVYKSALLPKLSQLSLPSYTGVAVSAALLFVTAMSYLAVKTGSDRYMLRRAQGVYASATDIFYYFRPSAFFSLFIFKLRIFLLRLWVYVLLNIPTLLCAFLLRYLVSSRFSFAVSLVLCCGTAAFFLSGLYFYLRLTASLFLAEYYYIKGEYLSFRHLTGSSQNAMKDRSSELMRLRLSFSGWFLSCIFILPVGYVWGYYRQTLAAFADETMQLQ